MDLLMLITRRSRSRSRSPSCSPCPSRRSSPCPSRRSSRCIIEFPFTPLKSDSDKLIINECWLPARCGEVPPEAFIGGEDNGEPMYVIRAWYNGDLLPGKLLPSLEQACVPWAGSEMPVHEYEVLCNFHGKWVPSYGCHIPENAIVGGHTADEQSLYIGRVVHDGTLTLGKVQLDGMLYIPFNDEELTFTIYEILCNL